MNKIISSIAKVINITLSLEIGSHDVFLTKKSHCFPLGTVESDSGLRVPQSTPPAFLSAARVTNWYHVSSI